MIFAFQKAKYVVYFNWWKKMNNEFKTLDELYNKVKPALYSKVMEFKRNHINYIKEEDIWNYLSITFWRKAESLTILDMVNDIMALKEEDMKTYVHDILRKQDRIINREEGNLL